MDEIEDGYDEIGSYPLFLDSNGNLVAIVIPSPDVALKECRKMLGVRLDSLFRFVSTMAIVFVVPNSAAAGERLNTSVDGSNDGVGLGKRDRK